MPRIVVAFANNGAPATGLSATIDIFQLGGAQVVTAASMTEIGLGLYFYDFTVGAGYSETSDFAFRADGSATLGNTDRYKFGGNVVPIPSDDNFSVRVTAAGLEADATASIADAVLLELVNDHAATAGSVAETLAILRGFRVAYVLDGGAGSPTITLDSEGLLTAGRIRVFSTPAAASAATLGAADGADGELSNINLVGTAATAGQLDNMTMID